MSYLESDAIVSYQDSNYNDEYPITTSDGLPLGHVIDEYGRLLKPADEIIDEQNDPEDLQVRLYYILYDCYIKESYLLLQRSIELLNIIEFNQGCCIEMVTSNFNIKS